METEFGEILLTSVSGCFIICIVPHISRLYGGKESV
jgi:hypothetical protein